MRVLGVTGTNGKTTTTYLLEAIARAAGDRAGVIGTVGARIAGESIAEPRHAPRPRRPSCRRCSRAMRDAGVGTVAMEVSSHALDQHRVDGTWFAAVCFTNLSHEHLDYHGSLDAYFAAKARALRPRAFARGRASTSTTRTGASSRRARRDAGLDVWTYARRRRRAPTCGAIDVELGARRARASRSSTAATRRRVDDRASRSSAAFNVANALAAAATARAGGLPVRRGRRPGSGRPGRRARAGSSGSTPASPSPCSSTTRTRPTRSSAVLAAARAARRPGAGVLVRVRLRRRPRPRQAPADGRGRGRAAPTSPSLTSDNPRPRTRRRSPTRCSPGSPAAARDVRGRARPARRDRRRARRGAAPATSSSIAGKGHETGPDRRRRRTVPFDDRVVAREELEALGWS